MDGIGKLFGSLHGWYSAQKYDALDKRWNCRYQYLEIFRLAGWRLQRRFVLRRWRQRLLVDGYARWKFRRLLPVHDLQLRDCVPERLQPGPRFLGAVLKGRLGRDERVKVRG